MSARTAYRICAVGAIITGLIAVPAGFAGHDEFFVQAGWVWIAFTLGQIATAKRMRRNRANRTDKENPS